MRANRGSNTGPERRLRSALHALGLRYRVNHRITVDGAIVRPDVVFARKRVAVFVDGCFWHGCPEHASWPKRNGDFWNEKITRTRERDREHTRALVRAGWTVVRVWEHEGLRDAVGRVKSALENAT
jgi:DNA mismatch endonuclease (patch repair protein)